MQQPVILKSDCAYSTENAKHFLTSMFWMSYLSFLSSGLSKKCLETSSVIPSQESFAFWSGTLMSHLFQRIHTAAWNEGARPAPERQIKKSVIVKLATTRGISIRFYVFGNNVHKFGRQLGKRKKPAPSQNVKIEA